MPGAGREDPKVKGTLTLQQWRRQEPGWQDRPKAWWMVAHADEVAEVDLQEEGQEHGGVGHDGEGDGLHPDQGHEEGQEDALEAYKARQGRLTRRWRDLSGERALEASEPATPRRRLVRVGRAWRS